MRRESASAFVAKAVAREQMPATSQVGEESPADFVFIQSGRFAVAADAFHRDIREYRLRQDRTGLSSPSKAGLFAVEEMARHSHLRPLAGSEMGVKKELDRAVPGSTHVRLPEKTFLALRVNNALIWIGRGGCRGRQRTQRRATRFATSTDDFFWLPWNDKASLEMRRRGGHRPSRNRCAKPGGSVARFIPYAGRRVLPAMCGVDRRKRTAQGMQSDRQPVRQNRWPAPAPPWRRTTIAERRTGR